MSGLERIQRILLLAIESFVLTAIVVFLLDAAVFRVRMARGTGIQSQQVDQFLKTPLKGGKMELDYLGTEPENCAVALLPQYVGGQWMTPCWWLTKHAANWQ